MFNKEKTKNAINSTLKVMGIVFIILFFIGFISSIVNRNYESTSKSNKAEVSQETVDKISGQLSQDEKYLNSMRKQFMDSCTEDDPTLHRYCDCAFNDITKRLGEQKLIQEMYIYYSTGDFSDYLIDNMVISILNCLEEL